VNFWWWKLSDIKVLRRERANNVPGAALPGGHFIPEVAPDETYRALREFLS